MNERQSRGNGSVGPDGTRPRPVDYLQYETSRRDDEPASGPARDEDGPGGGGEGGTWATRGLGWLGVGLGVAGLFAPGRVARLVGRSDRPSDRLALRLIGARQLVTGLALVRGTGRGGRSRPNRWMWSRVVGDAVDLGLLLGLGAQKSGLLRRRSRTRPLALAAIGAVTAADLVTSYRVSRAGNGDGSRDTDGKASARTSTGEPFRAAITINRPPAVVYSFWRHLENLPRFMTHLDAVETVGPHRSHWKAGAGGLTVEWDAEITEDEPNHLIAWRSLSSTSPTPVTHTGRVRFTTAPGNRGTEVRLEMSVALPGGILAKKAARLLRKVPEQLALHDLKQLKQIIETGSIARSDASIHAGPHPAQPSASGDVPPMGESRGLEGLASQEADAATAAERTSGNQKTDNQTTTGTPS